MTLINYFEILREVIDGQVEAFAKSTKQPVPDIYNAIHQQAEAMSTEWSTKKQPDIKYYEPLCRIAYLYHTVAINATQVEKIFGESTDLSDLVDDLISRYAKLSICAFGGGPGTELLGVIKWLEKKQSLPYFDIDFLVLDKVNEWYDSWIALKQGASDRFAKQYGKATNKWPFNFAGGFSKIDVTDLSKYARLGNLFKDRHIFIICYLISEVFDPTGVANMRAFIQHMVNDAPDDAMFLFIDRNESRWQDETSSIARQGGLRLGKFNTIPTGRLDADEQKCDLGPIYKALPREPRLKYNSFWTVGIKI